MSEGKGLIFLHLPKTGGTTLNEVFRRQYPNEAIWNVAFHDDDTMKQTAAEYRNMTEGRKKSILAISGHQYFGLHQLIEKPCYYFTMLRNPIERVISLYYFVQRSGYPVHAKLKGLSFAEFVNRDVDVNTQTLLLSGKGPNLERAKQNLINHFPVVGVTERFDESLFLLKRQFNWNDIHYEKRNVTKNRPQSKDISPDILSLIRMKNRLDFELYEFASRRLSNLANQLPDEEKKR